jgi:type II secretory pathway pseudopilin PulG
MPIGERPGRRGARGFTYLVLLLAVAVLGAGAATLGRQWQQQAQREREAELLFRGGQFQVALQRYAAASPAGTPRQPATLAALLADDRSSTVRHHLRRLWTDPFTGQADWVLLRDARGGITGLRSASDRPRLRQHDLPSGVTVQAGQPPRVADWLFSSGADTSAVTNKTEEP